MRTESKLPLALFFLVASCATNDRDGGREIAEDPVQEEVVARPASSQAVPSSTISSKGDDFELDMPVSTGGRANQAGNGSLLDTPSFRRRFEESYLSETEIEPRLDAEEREEILPIMDLIQKERFLEAAQLLKDGLDKDKSAVFDFTLANIRFQQDELDAGGQVLSECHRQVPQVPPGLREPVPDPLSSWGSRQGRRNPLEGHRAGGSQWHGLWPPWDLSQPPGGGHQLRVRVPPGHDARSHEPELEDGPGRELLPAKALPRMPYPSSVVSSRTTPTTASSGSHRERPTLGWARP